MYHFVFFEYFVDKQGFGEYASFAETGKQGGFGKTAILKN